MTKMHELVGVLIIVSVGLMLGALFFGGLWWTVQKSMVSTHPALWVVLSLFIRMAITLSGFYIVMTSDLLSRSWLQLPLCLFSFLIARLITTYVTRTASTSHLVKVTHHAPES